MWKDMLMAATLGLVICAGSAFAQQAPGTGSDELTAPPAAAPTSPDSQMGEAPGQRASPQQALVGLPIYSSDGENVGTVSEVDLGADGKVAALKADIGGFLGIGTSSVRIAADEFEEKGDRIVLSMTAEQVRGLPKAAQD